MLLSMGISENAARRGLYYTGDSNADLAAAWVFEHLEDTNLHSPFTPQQLLIPKELLSPLLPFDQGQGYKMVFVVNTSLQMGIGKIAAQVGHATLALYKTLLLNPLEMANVRIWEEDGAKKIVLKGIHTDHLMNLYGLASSKAIPSYVIRDAGKTQIPTGSVTVVALFGKESTVDEVTGKLNLL